MNQKDAELDPQTESTYECFDCGTVVRATAPDACPECGARCGIDAHRSSNHGLSAPFDDDPGSDGRIDPSETALETARRQLDRVAAQLDVDDAVIERLSHPRAVHEVTVPLERDDGSVEVFTGYRAQHDSVRGPTRAGSDTIPT